MAQGKATEWQFDGLVGPTHNYAGLAPGNVASMSNAKEASNPRQAVLQGIEKAWFVKSLGINQAFLPPQPRPLYRALAQLGFSGDKAHAIESAYKAAPHLLAACYSSSAMWVANAATIAPSADTQDGKVHLTPANLTSHLHRAIEAPQTHHVLSQIFANSEHFTVHSLLPNSPDFSDEGAANHMRVAQTHGDKAVHIFVYGNHHGATAKPQKFAARQRLEASQAIARGHGLTPEQCIFTQQHPGAIDAGVFHHDVIGMNSTRLMIHHEKALHNRDSFIDEITKKTKGFNFQYTEISNDALSLENAVRSYFFNSQLLEMADGSFHIIAPTECEENPQAHATLQQLQANGTIEKVHYLDVRQSMRNGGGPACLRLRIALTQTEADAMHQGIVLNETRYEQLKEWAKTHYRDRLTFDDLRDPAFAEEVMQAYTALDAITGLKTV